MQRVLLRLAAGASKLQQSGSHGVRIAACRGMQTAAPTASKFAFKGPGTAATAALLGAGLSLGIAVAMPSVALAAGPVPHEELTFIAIKPDGVQRGLIADIIARFERKGYKLVGIKILQPTKELAAKHYAEHDGKPFFPKLVDFLSSGPVVAMVWEGPDVIKYGRTMIGATNPLASAPGTIRGDYGIAVGRNLIHGSDSVESAQREIAHWFKAEELTEWKQVATPWLYE